MKEKVKKVLLLLTLLILSFNVYAEVSMGLDCNPREVSPGATTTCNVVLEYENESIKKVFFRYSSSLNLSFSNNSTSLDNTYVTVYYNSGDATFEKQRATIEVLNVFANERLSLGEYGIDFNSIQYQKDDGTFGNIAQTSTKINVVPKKEDCRLSSISINSKIINGFSPDVYYYDVVVEEEALFIDAIKMGDKVNITGLGSIRVRDGHEVTRIITITDADNSENTKEYTLHITNPEEEVVTPTVPDPAPSPDVAITPKSSDNKILDMALFHNGKRMDFKFDPNKVTFIYTINDPKIDKIDIKATLNDNRATFDDLYSPKEYNLQFGVNKIEILVIAENHDLKVYTLNIVREDYRDKNNNLSSVTINNQSINITDDKYDYEISSSGKISLDDIKAKCESDKAKVSFREILLPDGTESVNIKVTAENGLEKDYSIKINLNSDQDIEDIIVKNYALNFDKNKANYELTLENDESSLDIEVLPNNLKYEILGNNNLVNNSKIKVIINYSDAIKEYDIIVHKPTSKIVTIICYTVAIIGVLAITFAVFYYVKRKKK